MAPFPRSCRRAPLPAHATLADEPAPGAADQAAEALLDRVSPTDSEPPALVQFVQEAGPEGLTALTTRTRVRLVQGLIDQVAAQGTPRTPAQTDALVQLWRATRLDPVFATWQADKVHRLAAQIHNDPKVQEARERWPSLPAERKISLLNALARRHARVMGVDPVPVVAFHEPARGEMIRHARFLPEERRIEINTAPHAALHNFTEAMVTILHENTHNLQTQWADRLEAGRIDPASPIYLQAALFAVNSDAAGYIRADEDFAAYRQQPLEDHAEALAQAVVRRALSPVPGRGLSDPQPSPSGIDRGTGVLDLTERFLGRGGQRLGPSLAISA